MHSPSQPAAEPRASGDAAWSAILDQASESYRGTDAHALRFARAKLGNDRVFRHVLEAGLVPAGAHVVDAGCGQGLFASLLRAADGFARAGRWPTSWAAAPLDARVTGIDLLEADLARARAALADGATFLHADMRRFDFPACDRVTFLDTLHYIAPAEQDAVLANARAALRPGGALILRVHDASAGARYRFGLVVDRGHHAAARRRLRTRARSAAVGLAGDTRGTRPQRRVVADERSSAVRQPADRGEIAS
jgi:SAM-dependent methyltransferase